MEHATFVINVLEDSNRRSIEYENKIWLRNNVDDMNIRVCIEDCNVELQEVEEAFDKKDAIVVQNGERVKCKSDFQTKTEALLILNFGFGHNQVFQYFPKKNSSFHTNLAIFQKRFSLILY